MVKTLKFQFNLLSRLARMAAFDPQLNFIIFRPGNDLILKRLAQITEITAVSSNAVSKFTIRVKNLRILCDLSGKKNQVPSPNSCSFVAKHLPFPFNHIPYPILSRHPHIPGAFARQRIPP